MIRHQAVYNHAFSLNNTGNLIMNVYFTPACAFRPNEPHAKIGHFQKDRDNAKRHPCDEASSCYLSFRMDNSSSTFSKNHNSQTQRSLVLERFL
mmetsp:Transcript_8917/g.13134  ORF Transcript_8917/g.13134 Transcript_8917/m.13134 type:complete len:94 (-) Transcript_8917:2039-2320(-)